MPWRPEDLVESILWDPEIELRSRGLAASALTHLSHLAPPAHYSVILLRWAGLDLVVESLLWLLFWYLRHGLDM